MPRLPVVRNDALIVEPDGAPVAVGTSEWFDWLRDARSFTFTGARGTFTARHEERSGSRFWYAYRRKDSKLRKVYLGRAAELTLDRLEQAAQTLARKDGALPSAPKGEWASPLIATKMTAPQPGMPLVARPAIVARCLESIERPCAIISAPPGFGKTTLLIMASEQLKARGWAIAWVSLEETERDPVRFWTYVLAALDSVRPGSAAAALRLLETPRPLPIETVLTALVNALATATEPIALVLDDYHRAATPASDEGLAFLIEHAPPTLHLVITTRTDPAFPLARMRARGWIAELHASDLRFSTDEAARFMRDTMRVSLPFDQVARLEERTEGWVAGLQLAALSLRGQGDTLDLGAVDSTTPRYIAEYLIDEVLDLQPDDVQAFLLQTSMLERLSGPLCDAITGRTDSAAMLARLVQAQLFVTPLDPGQTWYRYHHLFAEVLRERLERTAPEILKQCHQHAAEWFRQQGMTGEAIHHLIAARALTEAAVLIEGESDRLILRGEITGLLTWVRALPRDLVLAHHHLCVLFAVGLLLHGEGPEAITWLDDLERHLDGSGSSEIRGEIAAIRGMWALMMGNVSEGVALAREAVDLLPPDDHLLRALALWLISIIGFLGDEDLFDVNQRMTRIAQESSEAGNIFIAFIALVTKAGAELYQGRLYRAAQTSREALRLVSPVAGEDLPLAAMAYCLLGEIRREWNDLDGAERDLRRGLTVGMHMASAEFVDDGLISLAMVQSARGKYEEALGTLEEIRHLARIQRLAPWDTDMMDYTRVRVLIAADQIAEAARWAEEYQRTSGNRGPVASSALMREAGTLALARVALAQGHPGEATALLEGICEQAARAQRWRNVLEARMLLARARWMSGERDAALCDLDEALTLAAPEGFVRVFLDEGEPMADVLAGYVASRPPSRERSHALKLLTASGRAIEPAKVAATDTLSPLELEVLRLLATGRSNEAIAGDLVVALSTVKWHVARIYRKLGVTGRVRAVTRARELRLIA